MWLQLRHGHFGVGPIKEDNTARLHPLNNRVVLAGWMSGALYITFRTEPVATGLSANFGHETGDNPR